MSKIKNSILVLLVFSLNAGVDVYAKSEQPFVVGVFPRHSFTENLKMFTPLAKYLEAKLGRKVVLESSKNFSEFWEKVKHKRYDLVHLNQYQYLSAHKESQYEIIAKNEEFGRDTITSLIIVKKSSPINSIKDLKGKRIIFGGNRTAMMSYILPRAMLKNAGLRQGDYSYEFALNPPNALAAVALGQADACGVGDVILKLDVLGAQYNREDYRVIKRSQPVPHLAWAVKPSLTEQTKNRLRQILSRLDGSQEGKRILKKAKLTNIKAATHSEYQELYKYLGR
jgi:phosphonate transport system substrate-binding protein